MGIAFLRHNIVSKRIVSFLLKKELMSSVFRIDPADEFRSGAMPRTPFVRPLWVLRE